MNVENLIIIYNRFKYNICVHQMGILIILTLHWTFKYFIFNENFNL